MTTTAASLRARIPRIDQYITALESQLTLLRAEKEEILRDLDSIVFPVLTLPCDIVSEIFLHVSAQIPMDDFSRPQQTLALASVCRAWRAVALSTCALWNRVTISCDSAREPGKLLQAWLPRAGRIPLDLHVCLAFQSCHAILSILYQYSSRWRNVTLTSEEFFGLSDDFPSALNSLESLTIHEIYFETYKEFASSHCIAPRLRELSIESEMHQLGLPLTSLTILKLIGPSFAEILPILVLAPNLKHLIVGVYGGPHSITPPSLVLPHLSMLECTDGQAAKLLDYLTLPALTCLKLFDVDVASLASCVSRSHCKVHALDLSYTTFDHVYACVMSLPTITDLTLTGLEPESSYDSLEGFCTAMESGSCLPTLESLSLCEWRPDKDVNSLFRAVATRYRGVEGTVKLKNFTLMFATYSWIDPGLEILYELKKEGLQLHLHGVRLAT
ncbi:hypothetical protein GGX14DRAFT_575355 [Mycena pura]|uniref:F-box domain-containing protein n=1 Tax=Mycena pura TaxID=153505 RepID=A0AAD6UZ97_9AGAR|nr:hypothetical protein GGX14DRAFT_575355 [Mycena pura]